MIEALIFWLGFIFLGFGVNFLLVRKKNKQFGLDAFVLFLGLFVFIVLAQIFQFLGWSPDCLWVIPIFSFLGLFLWLKDKRFQYWDYMTVLHLFLAVLMVWWLALDMPLSAWDSWLVWELKAKQWLAHGWSINLLQFQDWLHSDGGVVSSTAHYPDGLSLLFFLGKWMSGSSVWMAWFLPLVYVTIVVTVIDVFRKQGASWSLQIFGYLVFFTLPLINNHIMMEGYADIWLAMTLLLLMVQLAYRHYYHHHHFLMMLSLIFLLPAFKLEGWFWVALFLTAQFIAQFLNNRYRLILAGLILVVFVVWFVPSYWHFSWAGRTVVFSQFFIQLGSYFSIQLVPHDISSEIITGLLLQNNWGLLWYFLPVVMLIWVLIKYPKDDRVNQVFFVLSFVSFVLLFTFTDAAQWAENYAAVNRVVLQLTLCFVFLLLHTLMSWDRVANKRI